MTGKGDCPANGCDMGNILGLDISADHLSAVVVKSGLKTSEVTGWAGIPLAHAGNDLATGLERIFEQIDPRGCVCYCALPGGRFSYRTLTLPFTDDRKIRQVLAFELETRLASPIDELVIDFTVADRTTDHSIVLAAAVERGILAECLDGLAAFELDPECLEIQGAPVVQQLLKQADTPAGGLFLYLGYGFCSVFLFGEKRLRLVRRLPLDGVIQPADDTTPETPAGVNGELYGKLADRLRLTLNGYASETGLAVTPEKIYITGPGALPTTASEVLARKFELPVSRTDLGSLPGIRINAAGDWRPELMDSALALALRDAKPAAGFNFRRDEFQIRKQFARFQPEIRSAVVYLALIMLLGGVDLGIGYFSLQARAQALKMQMEAIFTETFPEVTRVVDPVQQMSTRIEELRQSSVARPGLQERRKVLDLLADISARIPGEIPVVLNRLVVDQDGVQIKGNTETFNTVDNIKKGLDGSGLFREVTISSANLDRSGEGVQFEIRMKRNE